MRLFPFGANRLREILRSFLFLRRRKCVHSTIPLFFLPGIKVALGSNTAAQGELPADEEEAIAVIYDDFRSGCKHITYPDGYIADDLYEMMDL